MAKLINYLCVLNSLADGVKTLGLGLGL